MNNQAIPSNIDDYIAQFDPALQTKLQELRNIILTAAPNAKETISYQMPAFQYYGNLVYFAGYKHHIGFYPTSSGIKTFRQQLAEYKTSTGAVQFPIDQPLPADLISQIVVFRANENRVKHDAKIKNLPR